MSNMSAAVAFSWHLVPPSSGTLKISPSHAARASSLEDHDERVCHSLTVRETLFVTS